MKKEKLQMTLQKMKDHKRLLNTIGGGSLVAKECLSLAAHRLQPVIFLCPWDFPGKNTGVGCYFLLQGIFPTQGLNPSVQLT